MNKSDVKIIPLISNVMFKELFGNVENKEATAYLLSTLFELDYRVLNKQKKKLLLIC